MQLVKTSRDNLLRPLQIVSGIVERRHTLPILANVLMRKNGEAIGTIVTELAPTIGGSKVRAYGSLELRGSDGSTGRVRLDREGLLVADVADPAGDPLRLSAPLK